MKVKKLEKFQNKIGSTGFKWPSLNAAGTEFPRKCRGIQIKSTFHFHSLPYIPTSHTLVSRSRTSAAAFQKLRESRSYFASARFISIVCKQFPFYRMSLLRKCLFRSNSVLRTRDLVEVFSRHTSCCRWTTPPSSQGSNLKHLRYI